MTSFPNPPEDPDRNESAARSDESDASSTAQWSEEAPVSEGYYWYHRSELNLLDVLYVYERHSSERLVASGVMVDRRTVESMPGKWAGPLSQPPTS